MQGTEVDKRTQPAMKLPRKAITRAERFGRDINMRPQWLQKDKSRVGKQSGMVRRRAATRGLFDEAWLHWTAPSRESPLADVDHRRFRGLKVKMSKVKGGVTSSHFQAGQGPGMPPRIWVQIRSSPQGGPGGACPRQGPVNPWIRRAPLVCPLTPPPVFQPSDRRPHIRVVVSQHQTAIL